MDRNKRNQDHWTEEPLTVANREKKNNRSEKLKLLIISLLNTKEEDCKKLMQDADADKRLHNLK
jgi:hypothetical protein